MNQIKTVNVERVSDISKKEFIEKYYKPQRPVIIEGLMKDWPAHKKWTIEFFQEHAGEQIVPLYNSEPTKGTQNSAEPVKEMKMFDYLELLKTQPTDLRIFFFNLLDNMPELLNDFSYPDIGLKFFKRLPVMFFGGGGSRVLPHYDMDLSDLLHFHFQGNKSVTLFSPEQTKYLYKVPFAVHNLETIDMDRPDFNKYPALQNVIGIQAEMKAGDALYMPSGYWHYIKYLDGGFSITLRALPKHPVRIAKMLGNVFMMRPFENIMRKSFGQKWVDYKEAKILSKTNKKFSKSVNQHA
ncbi:cupin-like domain-containing protein [Ulvibacter antarcticus]|uniref:Cupin-like domain-containing protein n=1 Tax=Ulvibacter antarcticus TaxID=442714 RepID=A0A3L9Z623_9FLAO|nr:cupin-like domain-containing protein [Ulvibacter antarcticus]RMA65715.1 Cupin-like domain-containing protein [Ulvibacter antarcticus]